MQGRLGGGEGEMDVVEAEAGESNDSASTLERMRWEREKGDVR